MHALVDRAPPPPDQWRARAGALLRALSGRRRLDGRRGLFGTRRLLFGRTYEHLWPFACAWSAMETAAGLGGGIGTGAAAVAAKVAAGLGSYHRAPGATGGSGDQSQGTAAIDPASGPESFESSVTPPLGRGGEVYYDDNAWVALALLEHQRRRQDPASLALARRVVAFCCTGWSTEPGWSHPGGVRWKVPAANRSRNACANGPLAEAAALVHTRTGDAGALEWAVRIYGWVRDALLGPNGLYLDRIMPDGTRVADCWTYNQGTMIGAGVLLAEATGEAGYLDEARATAEAALAHFDVDTLLRQGPAFNAIFFRNMLLLDRRVPDTRIRSLAAAYGECTWEERSWRAEIVRLGRRPLNGVAPLLEVYALLAGAPPHP